MRRNVILAGILAAGVLLTLDTSARAQDYGGGSVYGFSRYYDPPGGWPRFGYYGLGVRDPYPLWQNTYTPSGTYFWYGSGYYGYVPHQHTVMSVGYRPFGMTQSIYPYPIYRLR